MYRILLVDDEELFRESLSIRLSEIEGVMVCAALSNGKKALEWLWDHFADICLTEVRMPLVDGLQLMEEINAKYPWMVNMVMSRYDDFQYAKKSILLGAVDYVLKPVNPLLLKKALAKAFDKSSVQRRSSANQLLLSNLPNYRDMLDRWFEMIMSVYLHDQPLLIVDTLKTFEEWVEERYDEVSLNSVER